MAKRWRNRNSVAINTTLQLLVIYRFANKSSFDNAFDLSFVQLVRYLIFSYYSLEYQTRFLCQDFFFSILFINNLIFRIEGFEHYCNFRDLLQGTDHALDM